MPIRAILERTLDLVYIDPRGTVTSRELTRCIRRYAREPGFHPEVDVLIDFRGMVACDLGSDRDIQEVAQIVDETRGGKRTYRLACLVRSDHEETLVSISDGVLYHAAEARTFYDLGKALHWLGRSPEAAVRVEGLRHEAKLYA